MKINWERMIFGLPTLLFCFVLIILDAAKIAEIDYLETIKNK